MNDEVFSGNKSLEEKHKTLLFIQKNVPNTIKNIIKAYLYYSVFVQTNGKIAFGASTKNESVFLPSSSSPEVLLFGNTIKLLEEEIADLKKTKKKLEETQNLCRSYYGCACHNLSDKKDVKIFKFDTFEQWIQTLEALSVNEEKLKKHLQSKKKIKEINAYLSDFNHRLELMLLDKGKNVKK
jgi:hypothetical protein